VAVSRMPVSGERLRPTAGQEQEAGAGKADDPGRQGPLAARAIGALTKRSATDLATNDLLPRNAGA
jgi:hypothetical protein